MIKNTHFHFFITYVAITFVLARIGTLNIDPVTLAVMVLAAYRAGRAIPFNAVFSWLREPFTRVVPHDSGADDETVAAGTGARFVVGELLTCPICSATWAGLALIALYLLDPTWGKLVIYSLGLAGGAELLHWRSEFDQWKGREGRANTGRAKEDKYAGTWERQV